QVSVISVPSRKVRLRTLCLSAEKGSPFTAGESAVGLGMIWFADGVRCPEAAMPTSHTRANAAPDCIHTPDRSVHQSVNKWGRRSVLVVCLFSDGRPGYWTAAVCAPAS